LFHYRVGFCSKLKTAGLAATLLKNNPSKSSSADWAFSSVILLATAATTLLVHGELLLDGRPAVVNFFLRVIFCGRAFSGLLDLVPTVIGMRLMEKC
jgi:hypothetical protein